MYVQILGFGLTVSWLWLFFLSGPVLTVALKQWPGNPDSYFLFFMICTSLTFLFAGKWLRPSLLNRKNLLKSCAGLMSGCAALICWLPGYHFLNPILCWIIYPLIAAGNFGLTLFLLGWLETFLVVPVKRFALTYAGGITIASILLLVAALNFYTGVVIILTIPWLALWLILKQSGSFPAVNSLDDTVDSAVKHAFPFKLIWLIILFYTAGGLMFKLVGIKYVFADFFWISNISYMIVVILAGSAVYFFEELDLRLLYRPVLPLLAAGFILFPFLTGNYAMISFLLLQAGFALFDMYTWLVIVYIARGHSQSLRVLGLGMFWITLAMFGGNLFFTILAALIPLNRPMDWLAIMAGLVTLMTVFVFQEKKETFAGWETINEVLTASNIPEPSERNPAEDKPISRLQQGDYQQFVQNYDLTPRETQILILILKGRNNPFIRENLNISPNTLKFHLRNIFQKLAVNNRQEALSLFENKTSITLNTETDEKS